MFHPRNRAIVFGSFASLLALLVGLTGALCGCITTDIVNPDGTISRTRSLDIGAARDILFFALEAFDIVTARIAAYEAQDDELSEPDAVQLLLARAREDFLRRGIEFLSRQFDQLEAGQEKIRVPVGLMRQVERGIETELGIPAMLMSKASAPPRIGFTISLGHRPPPSPEVSPNDEPWRYGAAGFAPPV